MSESVQRVNNTWKWQQVTELLHPENSEPCLSTLLSLFDPIESDNGKSYLEMNVLELVRLHIAGGQHIEDFIQINSDEFFSEERLRFQINVKTDIMATVESYLLAYWDDEEFDEELNAVRDLAMGTFAYFLANETQKSNLIECFKLLAENIKQRIPQLNKRKVFGRTLYGVLNSVEIETWVNEHIDALRDCASQEELFSVLWPLIGRYISNSNFQKCDPQTATSEVAVQWINGQSFSVILNILKIQNAKLIAGTQRREIQIEHVVDICENGLSFEGGLVVGAVIEMVGLFDTAGDENLIHNLQELQKRLKYGLPSQDAIALYEAGFADRVIAIEASRVVNQLPTRKRELISVFRTQERQLRDMLTQYPRYFSMQLDNLLS